jgi:uncharacterized membrane protein
VSHRQFRHIVIAMAFLVSAVVFILWPAQRYLPAGLNGWVIRVLSAFFFPAAAMAILWVFRRLASKDPLRANYERFRRTYELVVDAAVVLMVGVHLTLLATLFGVQTWVGHLFAFLLGGALVFVGNILPRVRPNNVIGIRTPWALRNERTWTRTHRIEGYAVVLFGITLLATTLLDFQKTWRVILLGTVISILGLPVLSFFLWRSGPRSRQQRNSDTI